MNRKQLFNLAKIVVSVVLLTLIFTNLDIRDFLNVIGRANGWWLLMALGLMMVGVVLRAWRWQILLAAIGVPVQLIELTAIYFIGFLFNNLLPSGLGGDAIRMLELNRHSEHGSDAVTSVIVDRFLGLSALQAIALVALVANWGAVPVGVAYFTVVIFGGGMVVGFLLINHPLYQWLRANLGLFHRLTEVGFVGKLFKSFQSYPLPAVGRAYLVAFLFNFVHVTMHICIGMGLGAQASPVHYAIFVPIASLVLLIPISFAGLGVREEAFRQLFGQIGVPSEIAVAMSLLVYLIGNFCTGVIGGIIYLLRSVRGVVTEHQ